MVGGDDQQPVAGQPGGDAGGEVVEVGELVAPWLAARSVSVLEGVEVGMVGGPACELSDEDVIAQLTLVKGIGVCTADMFLIFHLYRPDVLPVGDLELRRTVARVYHLPERLAPAKLVSMAEPWRPYRSFACLYFWQPAERTTRHRRPGRAPRTARARS